MSFSSIQIPSHIVSRIVISKFHLTKKFAQLSPNYIVRNKSHICIQSPSSQQIAQLSPNSISRIRSHSYLQILSYVISRTVISNFHLTQEIYSYFQKFILLSK